jgi:hypothetical protein
MILPASQARPVPFRTRTFHACEHCRFRRIKCNGESPCSRCAMGKPPTKCVYGIRSRTTHTVLRNDSQSEEENQQKGGNTSEPHDGSQDGVRMQSVHVIDPNQISKSSARNPLLDRLRIGTTAYNAQTDTCQYYGPSSHFCFVQHLYSRLQHNTTSPSYSEGSLRHLPDALRAWGMEKQLFTDVKELTPAYILKPLRSAFLPEKLGKLFISTYFAIAHPRAPILTEANVLETWSHVWTPACECPQSKPKATSILFMVLAIGALQCPSEGLYAVEWSTYFYKAADDMSGIFEEPTITDVHLLLLRAIYALQVGKTNWHYL